MKKWIYFTYIVIVFQQLKAQTGTLAIQLNLENNSYPTEITILAYGKEDTLKYTTESYQYEIKFETLTSGKWDLEITIKEINTTKVWRTAIVEPNKETLLEIDLYFYESKNELINCDSIIKSGGNRNKTIGQINIQWGNNWHLPKDERPLFEFGIGAMVGSKFSILPSLGVFFKTGFNYSHSYYNSDTSQITLNKRTFERYTYLSIPLEAGFRLSTNNQRHQDENEGVLLEGSILYSAPVLFRHVVRYGMEKTITHNLHQFKDLIVRAAIGYNYLLAFADYRLFDFIMGTYAELPKLTFGIKLCIAD